MNSKKAITLLVLVTLLMGLMPITNAAVIAIGAVTPGNGAKGDTIVVTGTGVTAGRTVKLYWDLVQAWDGEAGQLNTTKAKASGAFEVWFDVPEAINGVHYIWVEDSQTLNVDSSPFTVNAVIKLSSSSGLVGDKITIDGDGFSEEENVWIMFNLANLSKSSTNVLGSFTKDVNIPSLADGPYTMEGIDAKLVSATKTFTIGPVIKLNKDEGPSGTVVEVSGRGFKTSTKVLSIEVDGVPAFNTTNGPVEITTKDTFKTNIVIPATADTDEYLVEVYTDSPDYASADFEVTGLPDITLEPEYGGVNEIIGIKGENFTQIKDKTVYIYLAPQGDPWIAGTWKKAGELKTSSSGTFSGTFRVPAAANDVYDINAGMHDMNLNGTNSFRVGLMIVLISPSEGPQGAEITLSGVGFTDGVSGESFNVTIDDELVLESTADSDGVFSETFYVPNIDIGSYPVEVYDIDADIMVIVDFTVTDITYLELDPPQAANEYNITIDGWHFSEDDTATYEFVLWNETEEWDITTDVFPLRVYDNGNMTGYWKVYDNEDLSLGAYWLNVTDSNDIFAQIEFNIVDEIVEVSAKRAVYNIDDTVAFNIKSTFKQMGAYFKIYDPSDNLYWRSDDLDTWIKVGYEQVVPFYAQTSGQNPMILVPDAPLGTWTWKMYDDSDDLIEEGTFVVEPSASAQLGEQIEDLNSAVNSLQTDIGTVSDEVASVRSDIQSAITAANAAVNAANAATQAVNQVASTASDAVQAAQDAKSAAESAQNAANGLTTLVYGAIGASLVAALAAIVSLMQISRRIAG